jgi:tetratricopeptide (TPR) repeat protein
MSNELTELINLGAIQQMKGNLDAAKDYYARAAEINAENETLLNNMGMLLYQQQRFSEACEKFRQVIQINDGNATAWLNLGNALVLLNELNDALQAFRKTLQLKPEQYEAWEGLAKLYMLAGDMASAEQCWQQAIELNPSDSNLILGLAQVYVTQSKPDEALSAALHVLSQESQNTKAIQTAGLAHLLKKNYGLAIQFLRQYLGFVPGDANVRNHLALALLQTGDIEAGKTEYDMILKLEPDNEEVRINTGILCLGFKQWIDALAHFEHLLAKNASLEKAGFYKGVAMLNLGHISEAKEIFEALSGKTGEWAANAKKQLDILNNLN